MMVPDSVWESIKDIIPKKKTKVGRPRTCPRKVLNGICYVLKTGCQWEFIPESYGKTSTVHGIFMQWCRSGILEKIFQQARLKYEQQYGKSNWFAFDSSSKKSPLALFAGKNPTDRGKQGIKHALLVDRKGLLSCQM